eukprot:scaffold10281_cov149-Ochromonas_danica.AAC.2
MSGIWCREEVESVEEGLSAVRFLQYIRCMASSHEEHEQSQTERDHDIESSNGLRMDETRRMSRTTSRSKRLSRTAHCHCLQQEFSPPEQPERTAETPAGVGPPKDKRQIPLSRRTRSSSEKSAIPLFMYFLNFSCVDRRRVHLLGSVDSSQ